MILFFYRLTFRLFAPFLAALVWVRGLKGQEENTHKSERWGIATLRRPPGRLIWIHAASVGEMRSILPLVQALLDKNAEAHCLITTVTVTAARLVRRLSNPRVLHQYASLDHPDWSDNFLDHWQPDAVLWVESEIWPTMLGAIKERNVPLVMVNGRLSARSARRWRRLPRTIKYVLSHFDLCLAQSADDGTRLKALGAPNVQIAGNMKYAGNELPFDPAELEVLAAQTAGRPAVLFASTHDGEEAIAINSYHALKQRHPRLLLIVMPRHPARGDTIAALFDVQGMTYARRGKGQTITPETQIYLADTMGEAGLFYRLVPIVYLGNSLISTPGGGHNPIEPAHLGCAVIYGPNMWNFAEIVEDLRLEGGAIMVRDEKNLNEAIDHCLRSPGEALRMADAAQTFVQTQKGVLNVVLGHLQPYLAKQGFTL